MRQDILFLLKCKYIFKKWLGHVKKNHRGQPEGSLTDQIWRNLSIKKKNKQSHEYTAQTESRKPWVHDFMSKVLENVC